GPDSVARRRPGAPGPRLLVLLRLELLVRDRPGAARAAGLGARTLRGRGTYGDGGRATPGRVGDPTLRVPRALHDGRRGGGRRRLDRAARPGAAARGDAADPRVPLGARRPP